MQRLKELKIWQKSIEMVKEVYKITGLFPDKERYNMISQINRAAVSIPSNIAEGAGRNSWKEFSYFLSIAHGSSYELESQLIIAESLGYLSKEHLDMFLLKLTELQKMNYSLQAKLRHLTPNV